jgi:hypothetical protein
MSVLPSSILIDADYSPAVEPVRRSSLPPAALLVLAGHQVVPPALRRRRLIIQYHDGVIRSPSRWRLILLGTLGVLVGFVGTWLLVRGSGGLIPRF